MSELEQKKKSIKAKKKRVEHLRAHNRLKSSAINSLLIALAALSQSNASNAKGAVEENAIIKDVVTVTATRTERPVADIPNTVTVIAAEQMQKQIANGIDDLIRYEPGVSVSGGGRFGLNSFSIRGIGGDRVLTLVDGTPTADEFSFGPFLSSRRDFVDLDALKSVEIVRGPGSSIYGSNAIGGVVNFITKDPVDYLQNQGFAGSVKLGTSSADSSVNATVLAAFGNEILSGMLIGTQRDSSETKTFFSDNSKGAQRKSENPQDSESQNLYAKMVYAPSDNKKISFVAELFEADSETDVLSAAQTVSRGVLTNAQKGIDERSRERLSINYDQSLSLGLADTIDVLAYYQQSDAAQDTLTELFSRGVIQDRIRTSAYTQKNSGVRAQLTKVFDVASMTNNLVYGLDYDQSETVTLREGRTKNRVDGSPVREYSNFPTRDFPNSKYTSVGVFMQNEIELMEGQLRFIPALRYDNFKLDPTVDAIYLSGNTGASIPEGYDESEVSVKLGMVYDLNNKWSVFSQYAEGFRAPPLDAVNIGFTNFAGGYTTLPNANLRPERGESFELGFRRYSEHGNFEITAYQNSYDDFIEGLAVKGFNPVTRLLEFQARNLNGAEIKGLEFKTQYQLVALSEKLHGFELRAAYAYAKGENKESGEPLNSIDPQQFVFGLGFTDSNDKWGVEAVLTATDRKQAIDIDTSSLQQRGGLIVAPFETPSFANLDIIGHYDLTAKARINWGIFNLTDKQSYLWSEEFVQNPSTTNFDRLTEPGRNYSVTVKYIF